jgi:hypothetical protein
MGLVLNSHVTSSGCHVEIYIGLVVWFNKMFSPHRNLRPWCLCLFFAAEFLKDLQTEFQNWEAGLNSDQKPKSLWEELAVSSLYSIIYDCNKYSC